MAGRDFIVGRWKGLEAVAVFSRWGKVAASMTATILISRFQVDSIIFMGVAGAADPDLRPGDVVIATELLQHDMDASGVPPFERFEVPFLQRARIPAGASWISIAQRAANSFIADEFKIKVEAKSRASLGIDMPKVIAGLVATGDRFISDPVFLNDLRRVLPDLRCVEMEGAAVAQTCFEFGIEFAVVRVISDRADHTAHIDFRRFITKVAAVMGLGIASRMVEAVTPPN